jgi:hypothetical protein
VSSTSISAYLDDPFLLQLYTQVRKAGALRSTALDLTHECNLRCAGCYFFKQGMDRWRAPGDPGAFVELVNQEKARGTNFITVVGGEPSLALDRLKRLYDNFHLSVATNGLIPIPREGFENLPIGVAVWGDVSTDTLLRGHGRRQVFEAALKNYRNDERAFWYYTTTAGHAFEIERVVRRCIENGNRVLFNYYSDIDQLGGRFDHRAGFGTVREEIDRMIELFPEHILMSSYVNRIVSEGVLYGEHWGYATCPNLGADAAITEERLHNGNPRNLHFRAYHADFRSTRRCCTAVDGDCSLCFDVWQHYSWIILNMRKHLGSKQEFTNWLTTMYLFYLTNRLVDFKAGIQNLAQIHALVASAHDTDSRLQEAI